MGSDFIKTTQNLVKKWPNTITASSSKGSKKIRSTDKELRSTETTQSYLCNGIYHNFHSEVVSVKIRQYIMPLHQAIYYAGSAGGILCRIISRFNT